MQLSNRIIRLPEVQILTGHSRSSIYAFIARGAFPKQIKISPRSMGWPANEIEAINQARVSGKSESEIKQLVIELEAARRES